MPPDRRARADVFEYLVVVSSLVRPAAITFVQDFVRRAHGHPYEPLHPLIEPLLKDTHGIMVYQEIFPRRSQERRLSGHHPEDMDDDYEFRRLQFLQASFGELCAGLLQIRLSARALSGRIHGRRDQQ